jgi:UDP-N-acetylmuramate--L-alanine ligase/UDP-N-acetylenolpyruvoylglucosamine reductase
MIPRNSDQVLELLDRATTGSRVHLVGAGGCGMSGLGHLLLDLGWQVTGSDLVGNEEIRQLEERGARIHRGHASAHLQGAAPALVVYSSAIRQDNPELQEAERRRLPIVRRAVLLATLVRRVCGICVAGMHGKTTTTALLAYALEQLSANPGYAVGGLVPQLPRHARFSPRGSSKGSNPLLVVEADESDGTLCEFRPQHAIVLNVDAEHLDYYANLEAVCREFELFGRQTREHLVFCADDGRLAEIFARQPGAVSYGFNPLATYRLVRATSRSSGSEMPATRFEVWHAGAPLGTFRLRLAGEKNMSNAGAVVALLHRLGYEPDRIADAMADFTGAARRQQELFRDERFRVFDDYGHHPAEIEATLNALRELAPRRLLVAFQPHRYTRTQQLLKEFTGCFKGCTRLWLTDIYAASEDAIPGVSAVSLAEAMRAAGQGVEAVLTLRDLLPALRAAMLPGDLVLFLGAGDITRAAHEMAATLREETLTPLEELAAQLTAGLSPESVARRAEPLAKRTTLRVGGNADLYVEPATEDDLARVLTFCRQHGLKFTMLGRGSNLLIRDGGIRGVVICLFHPNFSRLEITGERLRCGAGVKLKTLSVEARRAGLTGLEFLEGIPGSLGGSMRMNAGAMGSWLFDVVESIRFMDYSGQVHERPAAEVNVEYRGCPLFKNHIALGAVLKGQSAPAEAVAARMHQFSQKRWETQPAAPSAGCIFKNPQTIPAGTLIDELGLKGTRVGGAVVSEEHGNFIVNNGQATARDVLALIDVIKQRVRSARGIELETEVEIIGEN